MKKYIYVLDEKIALALMDEGLKPITTTKGENVTVWVFENTGKLKFSKEDSRKVYFSNTLKMCF